MAKSQVSLKVPSNTESEIDRYQEEQGLEHKSEATRQLIEAGVRAQAESSPGERLTETAMAIAGVGSIVAALGAAIGSAWAWSALVPFLATTFVFAILLASIRVMAGRDLV